MECRNAGLGKPSFAVFRDRFSECALIMHQLRPINLQLLGPDSIPIHSPCPINRFRTTHKNLLRIASAQRACTAERSRINNSHLPSTRTTAMGYRGCCSACANCYHVKFLSHAFTPISTRLLPTSPLGREQPNPCKRGTVLVAPLSVITAFRLLSFAMS